MDRENFEKVPGKYDMLQMDYAAIVQVTRRQKLSAKWAPSSQVVEASARAEQAGVLGVTAIPTSDNAPSSSIPKGWKCLSLSVVQRLQSPLLCTRVYETQGPASGSYVL